MEIHPLNYIDIFSIKKDFEEAKNIIFSLEDAYNFFEYAPNTIEDKESVLYDSAQAGLWLLKRPQLIYDLVAAPLSLDNK